MSSKDVLLSIATAARLFHESDGTGFADLIIEDHRETWPLRSKRFQAWLRQYYYERTSTVTSWRSTISGLPPWLSDSLCRLTSGGAFSTRRLFTDHDEVLFAVARPVILNGIEDVITRPHLADRAIPLTLAPIAEQ